MYQWTSFASLLLAIFVASPGYAATLYAVGPWDLTEESNLYSIDTTTGGASFIGSTGVPSLGGIALASDGTLYAYDLFNFYTLDPTMGTATPVGSLGLRAPEGALDFQPGTGTLYGVNASITSGDELLTIDLSTGAASVIGDLGPQGRDPSGLAFRSDGTLFGVAFKNNTQADDQLITIDPATAAVTVIGLLGTSVLGPTVGGLAFDASDNLYYSDGFSLYGLDLTTGAGTLIGAHGAGQRIAGLTFVPEPGTATLLGLGMLGLAAGRRR